MKRNLVALLAVVSIFTAFPAKARADHATSNFIINVAPSCGGFGCNSYQPYYPYYRPYRYGYYGWGAYYYRPYRRFSLFVGWGGFGLGIGWGGFGYGGGPRGFWGARWRGWFY